jgi:putative transcriptional regulator
MPKNDHGKSAGTDIIEGLRNAISYARGRSGTAIVHKPRVPRRINVKAVRARLGMSQQDFAARFGISSATVRNWEQGRRQPEGPARVLLTIIDREPDAVRRALGVR